MTKRKPPRSTDAKGVAYRQYVRALATIQPYAGELLKALNAIEREFVAATNDEWFVDLQTAVDTLLNAPAINEADLREAQANFEQE